MRHSLRVTGPEADHEKGRALRPAPVLPRSKHRLPDDQVHAGGIVLADGQHTRTREVGVIDVVRARTRRAVSAALQRLALVAPGNVELLEWCPRRPT